MVQRIKDWWWCIRGGHWFRHHPNMNIKECLLCQKMEETDDDA